MHERLTNPRPQPRVDLRALDLALSASMLRDQRLLRGKINRIHQLIKSGRPYGQMLDIVTREIDASPQRKSQRQSQLPIPSYPPGLPIVENRDDIKQAIAKNQDTIICSETGS